MNWKRYHALLVALVAKPKNLVCNFNRGGEGKLFFPFFLHGGAVSMAAPVFSSQQASSCVSDYSCGEEDSTNMTASKQGCRQKTLVQFSAPWTAHQG